jgi:hypothetical protein
MNLNDRPTDDVPTGASDLGDMTVFVRDRAGWTKNHVMDRSPLELSLIIDCGLLGRQFLAADHIRRIMQ